MLELLISITLIAMMSTILFLGLNLGVTAWDKGDKRVNMLQRTRSVLEQFSQEIQSCYRLRYKDEDLLVNLIAFHGTGKSVSFITTTPGLNPQRWNQPLREVTYFVDYDPETGRQSLLLREASLNMGKPFEEDRGDVRTLIQGVERWDLSYLVEFLGEDGKTYLDWVDEAIYNDPDAIQSISGVRARPEDLPHAVRVELVLRQTELNEEDEVIEYKLVGLPPLVSPIAATREISLAATGAI